MALKNYYVVLGVSRDENPAGIRAAYRKLAKLLHPDLVGDGGTKQFQEIAEAYSVLSDPELRWAHDRKLDEANFPVRPVGKFEQSRAAQPEPLQDPRRKARMRITTLYRRCLGCGGAFPGSLLCFECHGTGFQALEVIFRPEEWS